MPNTLLLRTPTYRIVQIADRVHAECWTDDGFGEHRWERVCEEIAPLTERVIAAMPPPRSAKDTRVIDAGTWLIGFRAGKFPKVGAAWTTAIEVRRVVESDVFGRVSNPTVKAEDVVEALLMARVVGG